MNLRKAKDKGVDKEYEKWWSSNIKPVINQLEKAIASLKKEGRYASNFERILEDLKDSE